MRAVRGLFAPFYLSALCLGSPAAVAGEQPLPLLGLDATTLTGAPVDAGVLRGRFVLIDFWATWCAPCLEDLPQLRRLHREYGGDRFEIVGVSVDQMDLRDLRSWLARQRVEWPQVWDGRGLQGPLPQRFGVSEVPAAFFFDPQGNLLGRGLSFEEVESVLAAAAAP